MEGRSAILHLGQFVTLALKLDKGIMPLTRITRQDGEELRKKAVQTGQDPYGMPACWWGGEEDNIVEFWPKASKEFEIIGVSDERTSAHQNQVPPALPS